MQKRPAGRGAFFLKKNSLSQNCLSPGGRFGFPSSESQVRRVVAATLPHPLASRGDSAALGGWIEGQNRQCRARGELPSLGKLITELQTRKRVALWADTQSDAGTLFPGCFIARDLRSATELPGFGLFVSSVGPGAVAPDHGGLRPRSRGWVRSKGWKGPKDLAIRCRDACFGACER
jgi:hypothetical protein